MSCGEPVSEQLSAVGGNSGRYEHSFVPGRCLHGSPIFGQSRPLFAFCPAARDDRWMQAVAPEMNLSETAFLVEEGDGYRLRWFTPKVEVDLCGHATLASAHVLWTEGRVPPDKSISFHTNSGLLKAVRRGDLIELDFPLDPPSAVSPPADLLPALGVSAEHVGKGKFDYLVEVESEEIVRSMKPDFARLGQIEVRGVIVTARSTTPEYDFVSRFFAPWAGINEDPVTGSAHCCLGAYWQDRLGRERVHGLSGIGPRRHPPCSSGGRPSVLGRSCRDRAARRAS